MDGHGGVKPHPIRRLVELAADRLGSANPAANPMISINFTLVCRAHLSEIAAREKEAEFGASTSHPNKHREPVSRRRLDMLKGPMAAS
jgi:hypothetical protein